MKCEDDNHNINNILSSVINMFSSNNMNATVIAHGPIEINCFSICFWADLDVDNVNYEDDPLGIAVPWEDKSL